MKKVFILFLTVTVFIGLLFLACAKEGKKGKEQDDDTADDDDELPFCEEPKIQDSAFFTPGELEDNKIWVITDGRAITPVGDMLQVCLFPSDLVISPDGKYAFVLCAGKRNRGIDVVDLENLQVANQIRRSGASFAGLALSSDGTKLYFSGAHENKVFEYQIDGSSLTLKRQFDVSSFPTGIAIAPDGSYLLVCSNTGNRLNKIDLETGQQVAVVGTQVYPYEVAIDPNFKRAYVSNWGSNSVSVIDLNNFSVISHITVGKNPEDIVISSNGKRVYVANSDSDTISVIDGQSLTVL
ncbi:MAG: YncE family protein, partial [Candidatus Bathyarchaeia archaeon]